MGRQRNLTEEDFTRFDEIKFDDDYDEDDNNSRHDNNADSNGSVASAQKSSNGFSDLLKRDFRFKHAKRHGIDPQYALAFFAISERYGRLKKDSRRQFLEPVEELHWPVPPASLARCPLAWYPKDLTAINAEPCPLCCLIRRKRTIFPRKRKNAYKGEDNAYEDVEEDDDEEKGEKESRRKRKDEKQEEEIDLIDDTTLEVDRETGKLPSAFVPLEHNWYLHMVCRNEIQRIYERYLQEEDLPQNPNNPPTLDEHTVRVIAEDSQNKLGKVIDWLSELRQQTPVKVYGASGEGSLMTWKSVLRAAHLGGINQGIIERAQRRLEKTFPTEPLRLRTPSRATRGGNKKVERTIKLEQKTAMQLAMFERSMKRTYPRL